MIGNPPGLRHAATKRASAPVYLGPGAAADPDDLPITLLERQSR
jgi:hypothetical protein